MAEEKVLLEVKNEEASFRGKLFVATKFRERCFSVERWSRTERANQKERPKKEFGKIDEKEQREGAQQSTL